MRQLAAILSLALAAVPGAPALGEEVRLGDPLELDETTPIPDLLADPAAWAGRRVRVEGEVAEVCPLRGCWMTLGATDASILRVKVEDGVVVIPADAAGRRATVEGVVTVEEMSRAAWVAWQVHLAAERGATFDEATVGEGPFRRVQLRGESISIAASDG